MDHIDIHLRVQRKVRRMIKNELLDIDAMRQKVLNYSNLLNDITESLDAVTLIEKMNNQRNMMIDYIMKLEEFINKYHSSEGKAK